MNEPAGSHILLAQRWAYADGTRLGRPHYRAVCSCGWESADFTTAHAALAAGQAEHLDHLADSPDAVAP
jgi:hypothetical protein